MKKKPETTPQITKGYKVTKPDGTSKHGSHPIVFTPGETYTQTGSLQMCANGFHFCVKAQHCFNHYDFHPDNRVFEIQAHGEVITDNEGKSCCLKIEVMRQLTWAEVLIVANDGINNSGHSNSGNSNSGDRNSGNSNSGDSNSGDRNSGNSNSGDSNSGDSNSGYRNSGNSNSGNWNSGDRNSGNWNSGDRNSGDSNSGYRNSGAFCTDKNPKLVLFDKVSSMTVKEWEQHPACQLMNSIDTTIWVPWSMMTEEEKKAHPKYEASEGYTKQVPMKDAWANFWPNLTDAKKKLFYDLEFFDTKKFEEITGLKIDLKKK